MDVVCVAGARPNFMKVKPVMDALERRRVRVKLVHTGQHYEPAMSDAFFDDLGLRRPDRCLAGGSGTHAEQTARIMVAFEAALRDLTPDVVVVVGDVNSTVACALVAAKSGALVAHVEAGLRSRDWSMPEEINRVVTDRVSDYLFAPSGDAVENLRVEGYRDDQIHLSGNTMVDSLLVNLPRARRRPICATLGLAPGRYGVVTLHRPENVDRVEIFDALLSTLGSIPLPLVFPAHPRVRARLAVSAIPTNVRVCDALGYLDFLALQSQACLVLTDSGGIQEETTVLGIPCLTLRETTERPVTVSEGTNHVVGRDRARIVEAARQALFEPAPARRPALWDGHAGDRIAQVIVDGGGPVGHARPSERPAAGGRRAAP